MVARDYETDLKVLFPGSEVKRSEPRYFWVGIERDALLDAVRTLRDKLGIHHLTTIVGEDRRRRGVRARAARPLRDRAGRPP